MCGLKKEGMGEEASTVRRGRRRREGRRPGSCGQGLARGKRKKKGEERWQWAGLGVGKRREKGEKNERVGQAWNGEEEEKEEREKEKEKGFGFWFLKLGLVFWFLKVCFFLLD